MNPDYRKALLGILSRLDQAQAHTESALTEPLDTADTFRVEMVRELLAEMQQTVEKYLDQAVEEWLPFA